MRRAADALLSGIAVYVVVAACSGGGEATRLASVDAAGGFGGDATADQAPLPDSGADVVNDERDGGSDVLDALADALTDPVPDAEALGYQNGSRLRARRYVGADGSSEFAGWHDPKLNIDCSFRRAADDSLRCMPTNYVLGVYYTDSECTLPIAHTYGSDSGCDTSLGAFVSLVETKCGQQSYRAFLVGAEAWPPTAVWQRTAAGCTPAAAPSSSLTFYSLTEALPDTFVAATLQIDG